MTSAAHITAADDCPRAEGIAQRSTRSWIAELLMTSRHLVCLVCPLCGRLDTEICVLCEACLCPVHDLAPHVAGDTICGSCWRNY